MPLLRTSPADRALLTGRLAEPSHVVVVALCAAWCTTCREFASACEAVAASRPDVSLVWVDIEDDAALVGDLDVETFPTLAIFEGAALRHYGPVLPQASLVERLVADPAALMAVDAPDEVAALVDRLRL
ncbi:MAG TPA: thioredoxin family protein [Casimicrobiaceae bacterium]|nr:thioredoxin family protein [Casimicrobiaceae bacterium]